MAACSAVLLVWTAWHYPWVTGCLVAASLLLFGVAVHAARLLMDPATLVRLVAVALSAGWAAEQLGTSTGLLFGRYTYTDVLGPRLVDVPVVIPLMWFALALVGWTMARLLLWQRPLLAPASWPVSLLTAWLAAMIVTAFDLGADPYFVDVLGAWVMEKPDGGWFGETVEGFVGWMTVAFGITLAFDRLALRRDRAPASPTGEAAALALLLGIYSAALAFQLLWGANLALKVVAFFAMGLPLLLGWTRWVQWRNSQQESRA